MLLFGTVFIVLVGLSVWLSEYLFGQRRDDKIRDVNFISIIIGALVAACIMVSSISIAIPHHDDNDKVCSRMVGKILEEEIYRQYIFVDSEDTDVSAYICTKFKGDQ